MGTKMRMARSGLMMSLLGALALVGCGEPDPVASEEESSGGCAADGISIVSYNMLHGIRNEDPEAQPEDRYVERLELLASHLADLKPDVILLQEFAMLSNTERPDPGVAIQEALGGEEGGWSRNFAPIGGTEPNVSSSFMLGQAIITCLPVEALTNRTVNDMRTVFHARVTAPDGALDVYNAHIDGGDEGGDELVTALAFVDETSASERIVFAGDLNSVPGEPAVLALEDAGFVDLAAAAGLVCESVGDAGCTAGTIPLGEPGRRADERIDYIWQRGGEPADASVEMFLDEPFDLGDGQVLWGSDHIGVTATIR